MMPETPEILVTSTRLMGESSTLGSVEPKTTTSNLDKDTVVLYIQEPGGFKGALTSKMQGCPRVEATTVVSKEQSQDVTRLTD
jgi:hypothetical protein